MTDQIEVGSTVFAGDGGAIHWIVVAVESRIDPLGVLLKSGLTGVHRRDSYSILRPFGKRVSE